MLYWIAKLLALHYSAFHVFSYLTLRAILAVMSALSDVAAGRAVDDRAPVALPDRPGGAR